MSRGLDAIKRIQWKLEDEGILGEEYELCDFIEKELKALEIIKKYPEHRNPSIKAMKFFVEYYEEHNIPITQETLFNYDYPYTLDEFNLLKEVIL